jgi:hypothetical protein
MALSCGLGNLPGATRVRYDIPADFLGMVHAGKETEPGKAAREDELMEALGFEWVVNTFYWNTIQPAAFQDLPADQWNWEGADRYVIHAREEGKKINIVLGYDVGWIHPDGNTHKYIPPEYLDEFLQFIAAVVLRYQGQVDAWTVWNEPNAPNFWDGPAEELFELVRQGTGRIRELDDAVIIIAGGFNQVNPGFAKAMFSSGALDGADYVSYHPYSLNPVMTLLTYNSFWEIARKYGFQDRIWVTEVGYPTGGAGNFEANIRRVEEGRMTSFVVKTIVELAVAGARRIFWYNLFDADPGKIAQTPHDTEHYFGLVNYDDEFSLKSGALSFALCARYIPSSRYDSSLPGTKDLPAMIQAFYFQGIGNREGQDTLVLWNNSGADVPLRLILPGTGHEIHYPEAPGFDECSRPLEYDDAQGLVLLLDSTAPRFITWDNPAGEVCEIRRVE